MVRPPETCLSCRHFSLREPHTGVCKVVKGLSSPKATDDGCDQWLNCGQQYFIRTGWIKGRLAKEQGETVSTGTGIIC